MYSLTRLLIENYQEGKKNKLADIFLTDLKGVTYLEIVKELAVNGYEIEFIKANTKNKIYVGIDNFRLEQYSYYKLTKTTLMQERDKLNLENIDLKNKIKKLKSNNYNKPGQKILDDKETIQKIYEAYLQNWSLEKLQPSLIS